MAVCQRGGHLRRALAAKNVWRVSEACRGQYAIPFTGGTDDRTSAFSNQQNDADQDPGQRSRLGQTVAFTEHDGTDGEAEHNVRATKG